MERIPARILRMYVAGPDAGRRAAPPARDLLRADRLRDRAHRLAPPAAVAARGDRVGPVPHPADHRRAEDAAAAADRGRRARAVHAQGVPGPEAVLDRGPRHDRADARRADPARRHARRARGRDRDGPPRPAERARPQPRPAVRLDLRRVRGHLDARADHHDPAGRHRRRQVPPRRPGLLPAARAASRSSCGWSPTRATWSSWRRSRRAPPAPPRPRARARTPTATPTPPSRSSCTATPPSRARAWSPRRSTSRRSTATRSAARSTSSRTTRSASRPIRTTPARPPGRRTWPRASTSRSSTSTPTTWRPASSAVRLAFAFRQEFGHDVLIDLIGYRRFGHNEADEPAYTQPEMYQVIKKHPPVRELFARQLIEQGVVTEQESTEMTDQVWDVLTERPRASSRSGSPPPRTSSTRPASTSSTAPPRPRSRRRSRADRLRVLNDELLTVPDGFTIHPKLVRQLEQRREALEAGMAAGSSGPTPRRWPSPSLLTEGIPIRLTGQDTERGTFSQRHLVLHDAKTGQEHCPIQHLPGRAGADGAAQQPAVGDGLRRLRVRLLPGGARDARAVGGAVRRLRQRRAGDHRPVHRLRAWPSGARPRG